MNGSSVLSEKEKREMLQDAKDLKRGQAFLAARLTSQKGSIDDYIDFLSPKHRTHQIRLFQANDNEL